jgi:hypothetical protein
MAAGAWTFPNASRAKLLDGTFDVADDTFKMALFLSTSNLGSGTTTYAGVTNEHANANGYTTGGISVDLTVAGTTTVTVDIATDPVWTASGGSIVARFAAIYEVSGDVLCYCLLDSTPGDTLA